MNWTGALANQTLLLLVTMATLVSPFLYQDSRGQKRRNSASLDNEREGPRSSTSMDYSYARQSSFRMSAKNPQIGVRSSLIASDDTCHLDPVQMLIQPPPKYARQCSPTTQISFGCRGGCSSYSRVDVRNTTNMLRSCSCCRPTGFGFRLVKMKCDGFSLRTTVKFALGCHCRPCLPSVHSVDIQRLRDLLRATSITSIG